MTVWLAAHARMQGYGCFTWLPNTFREKIWGLSQTLRHLSSWGTIGPFHSTYQRTKTAQHANLKQDMWICKGNTLYTYTCTDTDSISTYIWLSKYVASSCKPAAFIKRHKIYITLTWQIVLAGALWFGNIGNHFLDMSPTNNALSPTFKLKMLFCLVGNRIQTGMPLPLLTTAFGDWNKRLDASQAL